MGWGEQVLRQLDGKPFYERARRRDPVLDAAIRDAVSACTGQATGNKYHAVQTEVDGIRFDGKAEAARWSELRLAERAGAITQLEQATEAERRATEAEERAKPAEQEAERINCETCRGGFGNCMVCTMEGYFTGWAPAVKTRREEDNAK